MQFSVLFFFILVVCSFNSLSAKELRLNELKNINSKIFFMRHALAPGYGDPKNFKIYDCSTQRNLSNDGINQAKKIAIELRKHNIKFSKVYSSFWCRCFETVKSMGLTNYELNIGLNSFFENHANKEEVMKHLSVLISSLDKNEGPYLFVTHYVVIGSFTNKFPKSGGIVVHDLISKINHALKFN